MEHLDQFQRYQISAYLKAGKSYGYIAKELEVGKSTICRKIKRNQVGGENSPYKAGRLSYDRQHLKHRHKVYDRDVWTVVNTMQLPRCTKGKDRGNGLTLKL